MNGIPILKTKRLILRELQENDIDGIFNMLSYDEVTKYTIFDTLKDISDARKTFDWLIEQSKSNHFLVWGIAKDNISEIIGMIGIVNWKEKLVKTKTIRIWFVLSKSHWRQGKISEVLDTVTTWSFKSLKVRVIEAYVVKNNIGSRQLLEKFKFEKKSTKTEIFKGHNTKWTKYSLSKDDFSQI